MSPIVTSSRTGRNLVLCFDGTNNEFGYQNTNVVRLVQALKHNPAEQLFYYDPGVGTLPEPGVWNKIGKWLSKVGGLAFGGGLTWKVQEAYCYLMDVWEPGDKVFLFGFSRGSYTARVLAGLLHTLGLLPRGNDNLVPYALRVFQRVKETPHERGKKNKPTRWNRLCADFRESFARKTENENRFRTHFLGLWDTVSSVGWVWDPARFPYTTHNPSVERIRHAISLDERRWFFRQNRIFKSGASQDHSEVWFAGVHCDVGGGYAEDQGSLWRVAFDWMVQHAKEAELLVDDERLEEVRGNKAKFSELWKEPKHESLTPVWWIAECVWKLRSAPPFVIWQQRSRSRMSLPYVNFGGHRYVQKGTLLHQSVLQRIRDTNYAPRNLSRAFLAEVRSLTKVESTCAYTGNDKPTKNSTVIHIFAQVMAAALGLYLLGTIHYKLHPVTDIGSFWSSIKVALSFAPGALLSYFAVWVCQQFSEIQRPRIPGAAVGYCLGLLAYVFRALTLLCNLPAFSNWTSKPVHVLVKLFSLATHAFWK